MWINTLLGLSGPGVESVEPWRISGERSYLPSVLAVRVLKLKKFLTAARYGR